MPLVMSPGSLLFDPVFPLVDRMRPPLDRGIGNDLTQLFLPMHLRISREVYAWRLPAAWDPSGFGGRPRIGNPQASLAYPPVWLVWWGGHPASLGWLTVCHLIGSGLGAYALARCCTCEPLSSAISGILWAASPYLLGHVAAGHHPHVWTVAWYPWCFLALIAALRGHAFGWTVLVACLSLAFLAGHPQEWLYLVLALAGATLIAWIARWRAGDRRGLGIQVLCSCIAIALILGITAISWLPSLALRPWTAPWMPGQLADLDPYRLRWIHWLQILSPFALGGPSDYVGPVSWWETVLGAGPIPCVLMGFSLFSRSAKGDRTASRSWLLLLVFSLGLAMGRELGLYSLLSWICPPLAAFRVPARFLFLAHLALAVLCALGFDRLGTHAERMRRSPASWFIGMIVIGCLASTAVLPLLIVIRPGTVPDALVRAGQDPFIWLGVSVCFAVMLPLSFRVSRHGRTVILFAVAISLIAYAQRIVRVGQWEQAIAPKQATTAIQAHAPASPFRIRVRDALYGDLPAMTAQLEKTNIQDSFQIQHAAQLVQPLYGLFVRDPSLPHPQDADPRAVRVALDLMNVAFVLTDTPVPALAWPSVAKGDALSGPWSLYQNPHLLPRAYVVPHAQWIAPRTAPEEALITARPRESVLMAEDPRANLPEPRQSFTPAAYQSPHPDRVEISVATQAPGLLVIADTWLPGWSATLNGRVVPILRGNLAQRVIALPGPGNHRIIMRYEPPGYGFACILSGLSLLAWAAFSWAIRAAEPSAELARAPRGSRQHNHPSSTTPNDS
jgi:hypothetical protein